MLDEEFVAQLDRAAAQYGEHSDLLRIAADMLEQQEGLLQLLQAFVAEQQAEFEESLSYEEQEQYRLYFDLEASGYIDEDPEEPFYDPDADDEDDEF